MATRFDSSQARQAWRQFARARGVDTRPPGAPRRWGPWLFLAAGIAAAALIYQVRSDQVKSTGATVGTAAPTVVADGSVPTPPAGTHPAGQDGSTAPLPATGSIAPGVEPVPAVRQPTVVAPSPYVPRIREPPNGTEPQYASALSKIPRSRSDRAPIGGVGVNGIHVDRIALGARGEDGRCGDATRKLSEKVDRAVQVCFRVVHQRRAQRLVVHWQHAGELIRRTFVSVPADRAYRTRAWLPLAGRGNPRGSWVAVVKTEEGIELARERFEVVP